MQGNSLEEEKPLPPQPLQVEEVVRAVAMPDGNLPMDVADMVRVMCPLLDIPGEEHGGGCSPLDDPQVC